jgi:hypothetical protein
MLRANLNRRPVFTAQYLNNLIVVALFGLALFFGFAIYTAYALYRHEAPTQVPESPTVLVLPQNLPSDAAGIGPS